jgi:hypothetical protein
VKGLRSHPRASQRRIYALSCIRTSENPPSEIVRKALEQPWRILQTAVKALLEPFRPPHNVRIRLLSLARTPFSTVSLGNWVNRLIRSGSKVHVLTPGRVRFDKYPEKFILNSSLSYRVRTENRDGGYAYRSASLVAQALRQ